MSLFIIGSTSATHSGHYSQAHSDQEHDQQPLVFQQHFSLFNSPEKFLGSQLRLMHQHLFFLSSFRNSLLSSSFFDGQICAHLKGLRFTFCSQILSIKQNISLNLLMYLAINCKPHSVSPVQGQVVIIGDLSFDSVLLPISGAAFHIKFLLKAQQSPRTVCQEFDENDPLHAYVQYLAGYYNYLLKDIISISNQLVAVLR